MDWVRALLERTQGVSGSKAPATLKRMHGMLTAVSEELPDVCLHYMLPDLCGTLHCTSPRMDVFRAAIINAGYRVSATHRESNAVKTDAPPALIWDILRWWVKKHPVSAIRRPPGSASAAILDVEPTQEVNFDVPASLRTKPKATRYQENPEAYWGPKRRAGTKRPDKEAGGERKRSRK
jgi:tRNA (guanine26-N2/guanine27-N2)-dimethyltransferase